MDRLGMLLLVMAYETIIKPWRIVVGIVKQIWK